MKRDPALASLSRDDHQTPVVAQALRRATSTTADTVLRERGAALAAHVRGEERELFVLIEEAVPAADLAELAAALARAEAGAPGS